jgi:CubicO group peptidase (beta-lactamase class C family)
MANDTLMLWLSAGKPVTALAVMMLWERGQLGLDEPVAAYWPEFGSNGKEGITIRHCLTHTAGIRGVDTSYPFATWDETLAKIAAMRLEREWLPGMKAGYHTHTTWYVLGEVIRRLTGVPVEDWARENIFVPLGMHDTWMAMPPAQYAAYGERIAYLYDTSGAPAPPKPLLNYDTELAASRARPSASCRGPIRELARFYEMLRRGGEIEGARLLKPETVKAITMRQRVGMFDQTFRQTIDWGLGVILNSAHYGPGIPYQFGPHASRETFGHGGSQSSSGFCDPRHKLIVSLVFNGCPGEAAHDKRLRGVLKALYEDLGMANG